ncbi:MAG: SpoIIE family protein phosphatase [Ignavibacteriaceae bacterium]
MKFKFEKKSYSDSLNPFTLNFKSKSLNREFNTDLIKRSLWLARGSILFAIGLYLIFGFLDDYIIPLAEEEVITIRLIGILIFGIVLLTTFIPVLHKYYQQIMMLFIVFGGLDVVWLVLVSEKYGGYGIYVGIILTIIYAHSLLRLRFIFASLSTWSLIIYYITVAILLNQIPVENLINNSFFLIAANMLGMFSSYGIEYYMRLDFWKTMQIKNQTELLESEYNRKSKELESARQVQLSMIPQSLPEHTRLDIAVSMKTASEIGGDYYDFHMSEDNMLTFAIGDATGHGAQAGAMVTAIKTLFSNYAPYMEVTEFLKKANHFIKQVKLPRLFMSLAVGKIYNNNIEISGVGLPPLILFRAGENIIEEIPLKGMPLGSFTNFPFVKRKIKIFPGDILMFLTDGLPELFNSKNEMFGYNRLKRIINANKSRTVDEMLHEISTSAEVWSDNQQQDDITILLFKVKDTFISDSNLTQSTPQLNLNDTQQSRTEILV